MDLPRGKPCASGFPLREWEFPGSSSHIPYTSKCTGATEQESFPQPSNRSSLLH